MLPMTFVAPLALAGLLALPAIWWLLRVSPPRPKTRTFPPLVLLLGIRPSSETPARLPIWLMILRLGIVVALVLAAAGPLWRPASLPTLAPGPLWLIVDNGFSAAPDWTARLATADALLASHAADGRPVVVAATADGPNRDFSPTGPDEARRRLKALVPRAWFPNRGEILPPLASLARSAPPGSVMVLAAPGDDGSFADFARRLRDISGNAALFIAGDHQSPPPALADLAEDGSGVTATLRRIDSAGSLAGSVRLLDHKGRPIDERPFAFAAGAAETSVRIDLPLELKNEVARAEIVGVNSAAAVHLTDDGWRRRSVGILSAEGYDNAEPLLSPRYYLERALMPFADLRSPRGTETSAALKGFVDDGVSAIILADYGRLGPEETQGVEAFMRAGGVLIRFAGPHFAAADDPLVPVALRRGDRILGGALSWDHPRKLDAFPEDGPFAGLPVPADVSVSRQVLAEPSVELSARTWAQLSDGTPLVTARRVGSGWLVLFHIAADTRWSNLPISGTFVEMLRRTVAIGRTASVPGRAGARSETQLPPLSLIDGWGRAGAAPAETRGLIAAEAATAVPSRLMPAGLYGAPDAFVAVNLIRPNSRYEATDAGAFGQATRLELAGSGGLSLVGPLLGLAFLLLVLDGLVVLALSGRLRRTAGTTAGSALLAAMLFLAATGYSTGTVRAADDATILDVIRTTRLAYVATGNTTVDDTTLAGLRSLGDFLAGRSSLELGEPLRIDPERDDLALLAFIYWPIDATAPAPSQTAMARIETFMHSGGTVLFDTRDEMDRATDAAGSTPAEARLRDMLSTIDVPPLEPVPSNHVLTKSFYLLSSFPGRYDGSPLWVEAGTADGGQPDRPVRLGDGVSPILITGNDLAGAWAADASGAFLYPVVPGSSTQRDFAFRAGVNIVMYVLTGNYKADQVHVPALIERLGR